MWAEFLDADVAGGFSEVFAGVLGVLLTGGTRRERNFCRPSLIKTIVICQLADDRAGHVYGRPAVKLGWQKKENKKRAIILAILTMTASLALADDIQNAHRGPAV